MIITSVIAENVLKYQKLDLQGLPEQGVIAVSGQNESGKSTIGETVCFALFGRTFSLGPEDLDKVVRWGENHCAVTLGFKIDGTEYSISRFLDKDGNHSAKLALAGELDNPLARGVNSVADALFDILGYEYEEFVESFYLAQREITTPHPHSLAIKIMAGVAPLEFISSGYEEEMAQQDEMLEELSAEMESLDTELEELDFREGELISLEDSKNALEADLHANRDTAQTLAAAASVYTDNVRELRRVKGKKRWSRLMMIISLLLAAASGGAWFLLAKRTDLVQSAQLAELLQTRVPVWQESFIPYLPFAAGGFLVFLLLFWVRSAMLSSRRRKLATESVKLAPAMEEARSISDIEALPEQEDSDEEQDRVESGLILLERPDDLAYASLLERVRQTAATADQVNSYVAAEHSWLEGLIRRKETLLEQSAHGVDREIGRVRQVARIQEVSDGLKEKTAELSARRATREKAIELLEGASEHLSNSFNQDVRELVAKTLPVFTQDRYEHLKIDSDLTVRVFSSDKRDFMDLEEVSSGTQRQIMLALRLALSQKLLNRAVKGRQFAFLDEPFAFFDEERTRHALNALNRLSEDLSQIWIVSQTFPQDSEVSFARSLECSRDLDRLVSTT